MMRRALLSLVFALAALLPLGAARADDGQGAQEKAAAKLPEPEISPETGVRWYRDVAYVEGEKADPVKHKLDLLLPAEDKWREGRPMLIWIHGGGWTIGDKDDALGLYTRYCRILAENGVGTANISYRLSPGVKHPAHVEDVAVATAWVVARASEIGFEKQHLFVSGHSAGGHLAALLAADDRWLAKHDLPKGTVAGAIPSSGVFDLEALVASSTRWQRAFAVEDAAGASPLSHVDAADPPFAFIVEGKGAWMQSQTARMAGALKEAGQAPEVVTLAGVNHITMLMDLLDRKGAHLAASLKLIDGVVAKPEKQPDAEINRGQSSGAGSS